MEIRVINAGRVRHWLTRTGKERSEPIFDVYVNGHKLSRGICIALYKQIFDSSLKSGQIEEFVLEKKTISTPLDRDDMNYSDCGRAWNFGGSGRDPKIRR
jgi:hypothetical protein